MTPLVRTPNGDNCAEISGTVACSSPPCPFSYQSENGRITGHDKPATPAGTVSGQFAPDHLTRVWDFTGNGI